MIDNKKSAKSEPLCLAGDAYSIGYGHGLAEEATIHSFLADDFAQINLLRDKKLLQSEIFELVRQHQAIIEEDVPLLAQELQGLAKGANISYQEAILLQIRREVIGQSCLHNSECSLLAKLDNCDALIAQTVDLNGKMTELGRLFRISSVDRNIPEILMFSFSGLLGYLGMNSSGLGIGINFVSSDDWGPGVSPYLLVRHLLQLTSLDECLKELRRIRRSSSRSLTICDRSHLAIIEMTTKDLRIISGPRLLRTNHYLHEDLIRSERMNIFSRNASKLRLSRLKELVEAQNWALSLENIFGIFSDHSLYPIGLCAHSEGNHRKEDTVAAVVLDLKNKKLAFRKGHPCSNATQNFYLSDMLNS